MSAQDYTERKDLSKKEMKKYRKAVDASRSNDIDKALKYFQDVIKSKPDFVEAYLRVGSLYYNLAEFDKSNENFQKAISLAPEFDPEMYYSAGLVLHKLEKYDAAAYHFESYLDRNTSNKRKRAKAEKLMINSNFAFKAMANPVPYAPKKLSEAVNTFYNEYTPLPTIDGGALIFTRRLDSGEDFFVSEIDSIGNFTESYDITSLNTDFDEGAHTLSADGNTMIFTACGRRDSHGGCDLYYAELVDGAWDEPRNLGPVINTPAWESQPTLSADGQLLYFASNRKGSLGGKDIWVSVRAGDRNGWTMPINLGAPINTTSNDGSPFLHADGQTLYFRSDGHPGMGDFDMYMSRRGDNAISWSTPVNLGYPINTIADEGALTISLDGKTAYFASDLAYIDDKENRNLDIYSFELPQEVRPTLTTYLKVNVVDAVSKEPLKIDSIEMTSGDDGTLLSTYATDMSGSFTTTLPVGDSYALSIENDGYLFQSRFFDLDTVASAIAPYILTIEMVPVPAAVTSDIVYNIPVVLNNIFFETGSALLKDISNREIERLATTLQNKEDIKIRITGHTDNVGDAAANQKLSENRAKAVYDALVSLGVSPTRLSYAGLGETTPITSNDTASGRQQNRRTEFILVK